MTAIGRGVRDRPAGICHHVESFPLDSSVPYVPHLFLDVDQPLSLFLPLLELRASKSSLRVARLPRDVLARVMIVR